jgi:hypothetical protein
VLEHLTPDFNLVGVLVLVDLNDGELSLRDEENNRDGGLVAGQADADVGVVGIHQKLSLLIHFEEEVAGLHEEFLLVNLGHLHVFLVVRNQLASLEVRIVPDLVAEPLEIGVVG